MNTFNTKATNTMKIKSRTEKHLYYISTFAWGIIAFVTGSLFLFGMGIVSVDNWPF